MKNFLIDSATPDVEANNENYSEWRLLYAGLGSSFETVVVKEGFHNKDFQTRQGAVSVIDPEILGKLRKEASAFLNNSMRCLLAVYFVMYICCFSMFMGLYGLGLVPDDAFFFDMIVTLGVMFFLCYEANTLLRKKVDTELTALVESYQPMFLTQFGVYLGYGRFSLSPNSGGSKVPGIYLRRLRRVMEDEEAPDGGEDRPPPPIYLVRLIPGEMHIDEKEYDADLMQVDAETWSLLQSTHQNMIQWHPIMKFLAITFILGFYVGCFWIGAHFPCGGFIGFIVAAVAWVIAKIFVNAVDKRNLKVYEEVTKVVNAALHKDEKKAHVTVEFHASEVPGREGKYGRRYQFVQLDLSPTKELV